MNSIRRYNQSVVGWLRTISDFSSQRFPDSASQLKSA